MAWKGFVEESKSYMNHPDYWKEWRFDVYGDGDGWTFKDRRKAKLDFWRKFPRAWIRFYALTLRDWLKRRLSI